MNDLKIAVAALEDITRACRPETLSLPERCALLAGARALPGDLDEYVRDELHEDGYALEKLGNAKWHTAAALGFDITNGHPAEQHRVWAMGSLNSFESRP